MEKKDLLIEEVQIITKENDLFGHLDKANHISRFIQTYHDSYLIKNNIIGLYGEWGTGKSSVLKTVKHRLEGTSEFKCLWFDTWLYEKDNNLPLSLFHFILEELVKNKLQDADFIGKGHAALKGFAKSLRFNVNLKFPFFQAGTNVDSAKIIEELEKYEENKKLSDVKQIQSLHKINTRFYEEFNSIINIKKPLVVFIDDLDRCDSENILKLLSSLKLIFAGVKIIFICGIDKEAVELSLTNKYNNDKNKAEQFLDKIFFYTFILNTDHIKNYNIIEKLIDNSQYYDDLIEILEFNNPRKLKKIYNTFVLVEGFLDEYNDDISKVFMLYFMITRLFYTKEYSNNFSMTNKYYNFSKYLELNQTRPKQKGSEIVRESIVERINLTKEKDINIGKLDKEISRLVLLLVPNLSNKKTINGFFSPIEQLYRINSLDEFLGIYNNNIFTKFINFIISREEFITDINNKGFTYFEAMITKIANLI